MMSAPTPPDDYNGTKGATKEDWLEFKQSYTKWLESTSDDEIVEEMKAIPVEGRPLSVSEAWRFHECELRRRNLPRQTATKKISAKG